MSEKVSCVTEAQSWANKLVARESRGPGDMENAMRRLEARYGIPWRTFWSFKYRPPTDVFVRVYLQIRAAYLSECERQERLLRHEIEITKLRIGADAVVVRKIEAVVGKAKRPRT